MHARLWYNWWQRTCEVRYIPPSSINITVGTPSAVLTGHPNTPTVDLIEDESESGIVASGGESIQQEAKKSDHVVVNIEDNLEAGTSYGSIV